MTKSSNKLVFVVGMHRSLTSCITRMVQLCLGAFVAEGADLLAANDRNVPGYFESKKVYRLNERILEASGTSWRKVQQPPMVTCVQRDCIMGVVRKFAKHKVSVIKDPRLCVLIPYWYAAALEVYKPENIQVIYVVRSPAEVALSLQRAWGMDLGQGLDLWRFYNARAMWFLSTLETDRWMAIDAGSGKRHHFDLAMEELADRLGTGHMRVSAGNLYQPQYRHFRGALPAARVHGDAPEELDALMRIYRQISKAVATGRPFRIEELTTHAPNGEENHDGGESAGQGDGAQAAPKEAGKG